MCPLMTAIVSCSITCLVSLEARVTDTVKLKWSSPYSVLKRKGRGNNRYSEKHVHVSASKEGFP